MDDKEQVTHPPVIHPPVAAQLAALIPTPPAEKAEKSEKTARKRKAKLPPPQVLAAGVLAIAALELLLWQVGGVWWGVLVHAVLAGLVLAVLAGMMWRRKAQRKRDTAAGRHGVPTAGGKGGRGGAPSGGATGDKRNKGGKDRPGLLDKLRPNRRPRTPAGGGKPSDGRSPLGRLLPRGKSPAPGGKGASPAPGGRRPPGGGGGPKSPSPNKKRDKGGKKKPSNWWGDFWHGLTTDPDAGKKTPEKPPTEEVPAEKPAKEKPQPSPEQLVKEAVKKAAAARPAAVTTTGGNAGMGDMNKVRAAAEEFAAALQEYDPEDMHQMVREMPHLGEALMGISAGLQQVASRAETEWPVAAPVADGYRSIANDLKAAAGTADQTRMTIRRENETDIERGEAPRHGHAVERKWNV